MSGYTRPCAFGLLTATTCLSLACDAPGPTAPRAADPTGFTASVQTSRVQGPRPLRGRLSGAATPGDPCSATPPGLLVAATAGGVVSHLGATTLTQTACVSVPDFLPIGPSFASLRAADGDRLEGTVVALDFRADGFDMEIEITGGTGRFAHASGAYGVRVAQEAPLQPFSATIDGWVAY
jgi:hypothetical protein